MLKRLSKFVLEVLPSVLATMIGAYLVHHFITGSRDVETRATDPQVIALPKEDVDKLLNAAEAVLHAPSGPTLADPIASETPSPRAPSPEAVRLQTSITEALSREAGLAEPQTLAVASPAAPDQAARDHATPDDATLDRAAPAPDPAAPAPDQAAPAPDQAAPAPDQAAPAPAVQSSEAPAAVPAPSAPAPAAAAVLPPRRPVVAARAPANAGSVAPVTRTELGPPARPSGVAEPTVIMAPPGIPALEPAERKRDPVQLSDADRARLSEIPVPAPAAREPAQDGKPGEQPLDVQAANRSPSIWGWGGRMVGGVVKTVTSVLPDFLR